MDTEVKTRWTPGPWMQDREHFEDVCADSGELVVAAYPFVDSKRPESERLAEQKANALLISKAPEMAEFVRDVAQNGRLWRVLDEDQWNRLSQKAEALLSTLEGKI